MQFKNLQRKTISPVDGVAFPLLELLPASEKSAVLQNIRTQEYAMGEVVYERAGPCTDVFFIHEGKIRIDAQDPDGEMVYFDSHGRGGMIGFYSAITGQPQPVTATAIVKSVLGRMSADDFTNLVVGNRELSAYMLKLVTGMLLSETRRITHLIVLSALQRVAAEILERVGSDGSLLIEVPARVELAARIGITRETLAKQLSELRKRGLIAIEQNKIQVLDAKELAELVG
jgi:CRP/FNR family cyclic AMP-dependent transcriptional regulator